MIYDTCLFRLERFGKYPPGTVQLVTQDFGYHPGTTVEDLRTELASLRIDLGRIPRDWLAESVSQLLAIADLWEAYASLPATYEAMIQRAEWYLEDVPIDVAAKDFGESTLELLELIEKDEREK